MIKSFRHRGLERFFTNGDASGVPHSRIPRIERLLDRLDTSLLPTDMNLPGNKFHELKGNRKGTYSVSVTHNYRITFQFEGEDAIAVDMEDYH